MTITSDFLKEDVDFVIEEEANPGEGEMEFNVRLMTCLLYTSPSPRDAHESRMPSSA